MVLHLSDEGEQETVKLLSEMIVQALGTFDQEKYVKVSASGHMGFAEWSKKTGPYQSMSMRHRAHPFHSLRSLVGVN